MKSQRLVFAILICCCCVLGNGEDNVSMSVNEISSRRNAVKLTMKQALMMNQIIATYAISSRSDDDSLCYKHTQEFKNALRQLRPWAIQMFDSSAKLQAGILAGNLVEFGDFTQCLSIYKETRSGLVRGKHCTIRITPGLGLVEAVLAFRNVSHRHFEKIRVSVIEGVRLVWSVCVPDSCSAEETLVHFNKSIMELAEGLDIKLSLVEENCVSVGTKPEWGNLEIAFLIVAAAIVLAVAVGTIAESTGHNSNQFAQIFSAISNWKRLVSKGSNRRMELDCLHGIRFISVCYVMFGHRFMTGMLFPSVNSLYLVDWIREYTSTVITGGTVSVDSFFLVSGTLVAYNFFEKNASASNLALFYMHRYIRITLPLVIPLIVYCFFIQHFGSGPLWTDTYQALQKPCRRFWWSTLLHVQNYANPHAMCILQTWYLSSEMVYYYFSPLVLYPIQRWPFFGFVNLGLVYVASVLVNFYLAWTNEYAGGMPLTNQLLRTRYFQRHYIAPHVRASPYIIGLGFGYAMFKTKDRKFKTNAGINLAAWSAAAVFMAAAVFGSHVFQQEDHEYNRFESSIFLACSRSAWTLGIVWIIWTCSRGQAEIVNKFLSLHVFRVGGRLGYGIFLFHLGFQTLQAGAEKHSGYYSNFEMIYHCCADLIINTAIAALFSVCFEYPCLVIEGKLLRRSRESHLFTGDHSARKTYTQN